VVLTSYVTLAVRITFANKPRFLKYEREFDLLIPNLNLFEPVGCTVNVMDCIAK